MGCHGNKISFIAVCVFSVEQLAYQVSVVCVTLGKQQLILLKILAEHIRVEFKRNSVFLQK